MIGIKWDRMETITNMFDRRETIAKKNKIFALVFILIYLLFFVLIALVLNGYSLASLDDSAGYQDFIKNNKIYSRQIAEQDLITGLKNDKVAAQIAEIKEPPLLNEIIINQLNIGFLLENASKRVVSERLEGIVEYNTYTEEKVILTDNYIGDIEVSILLPKKELKTNKKLPAIIGLHGHADNPSLFKKNFFGEALVNQGYVVIMPKFSGMDCYYECNMSKELLLNGFTIIGLDVYKTIIVINYAKNLEYVDNKRIGAIGHSAGSAILTLLLRINGDISAAVADFESDYSIKPEGNSCCNSGIFHETVLGLAQYSRLINDNSSLKIPLAYFDYGYSDQNDKTAVVTFFNKNFENEKLTPVKKENILLLPYKKILSIFSYIKNKFVFIAKQKK